MKVLLISPQHWGTMRVTKHHYAIELAKLGHEVFFLEPTEASWTWNASSFDISDSDAEGVKIMRQKINIPYNVKFHSKVLYDVFIKRHIKNVEKQFGPFDLVWSFDLTNAMPLRFFSKESKKIFFAADWPQVSDAVKAVEGASVLVSVAQEILDQYPNKPNTKKLLIDHGVAECFIEAGKQTFVKTDTQIRIGMSGNFLRPEIDRKILLDIIKLNQEVFFEFFGSYSFSNLGSALDLAASDFIRELHNASNVILHGVLSTINLSNELARMDAFLICYDVNKDQSKGTNYHKVSEYLVYGKPIISNKVSAYKANKLVYQVPSNNDLISSFSKVVDLLKKGYFNSVNFESDKKVMTYLELLNRIINEL